MTDPADTLAGDALDAAVAEAMGAPCCQCRKMPDGTSVHGHHRGGECSIPIGGCWSCRKPIAPPYGRELWAAMRLLADSPAWEIKGDGRGVIAHVWRLMPDGVDTERHTAEGATAATAICRAYVKARQPAR